MSNLNDDHDRSIDTLSNVPVIHMSMADRIQMAYGSEDGLIGTEDVGFEYTAVDDINPGRMLDLPFDPRIQEQVGAYGQNPYQMKAIVGSLVIAHELAGKLEAGAASNYLKAMLGDKPIQPTKIDYSVSSLSGLWHVTHKLTSRLYNAMNTNFASSEINDDDLPEKIYQTGDCYGHRGQNVLARLDTVNEMGLREGHLSHIWSGRVLLLCLLPDSRMLARGFNLGRLSDQSLTLHSDIETPTLSPVQPTVVPTFRFETPVKQIVARIDVATIDNLMFDAAQAYGLTYDQLSLKGSTLSVKDDKGRKVDWLVPNNYLEGSIQDPQTGLGLYLRISARHILRRLKFDPLGQRPELVDGHDGKVTLLPWVEGEIIHQIINVEGSLRSKNEPQTKLDQRYEISADHFSEGAESLALASITLQTQLDQKTFKPDL